MKIQAQSLMVGDIIQHPTLKQPYHIWRITTHLSGVDTFGHTPNSKTSQFLEFNNSHLVEFIKHESLEPELLTEDDLRI